MRKFGLKAKYIRDLRPNYSKKRMVENVRANHLKHQFNQPDWVTDIMYLLLSPKAKLAYLSTINDLETHKGITPIEFFTFFFKKQIHTNNNWII